MTFWDFCAPFYDLAEKFNGKGYTRMLEQVSEAIPRNASVLEVAAGTGAISIAIAGKAKSVLCTDISNKMLSVARKKAKKACISNIEFANLDIFNTGQQDAFFDVVIAGQVLHLLEEPQKAAEELQRVTKNMVILPMCLLKNLHGMTKWSVKLWRLFGFNPTTDFDLDSYTEFLPKIGFENCDIISIPGKIPMAVALWKGGIENDSK